MAEGVLDAGIDSIFLGTKKFDQLMETVGGLTQETETTTPSIQQEEIEQPLPPTPETEQTAIHPSVANETETADRTEQEEDQLVAPQPETEPAELIRTGLNFFNDLARTLASPEKTEQLVASIIEEDKATGETHIKIPVKDKESIMQMFNLFGKLLSGK